KPSRGPERGTRRRTMNRSYDSALVVNEVSLSLLPIVFGQARPPEPESSRPEPVSTTPPTQVQPATMPPMPVRSGLAPAPSLGGSGGAESVASAAAQRSLGTYSQYGERYSITTAQVWSVATGEPVTVLLNHGQ